MGRVVPSQSSELCTGHSVVEPAALDRIEYLKSAQYAMKGGDYVSGTNKKLYHRMHKKELTSNGAKDCHHIFYQRRYWQRGALKVLRQHDYCRVYIPRNTLHKDIHGTVKSVPVPRTVCAIDAVEKLRILESQGAIHNTDGIEKRLMVLIALFDVIEPETTMALRAQLAIVRDYYYKPS